jgi:hypothetical protein
MKKIARRDWLDAINEAWLEKDMQLSSFRNFEQFKLKIIEKAHKIMNAWKKKFTQNYGMQSTMMTTYFPQYERVIELKIQSACRDKEIKKAWKKPSPFRRLKNKK